MPIGVYTRVYSATEPGFVSEDDEMFKALDFVGQHFKKGTYECLIVDMTRTYTMSG